MKIDITKRVLVLAAMLAATTGQAQAACADLSMRQSAAIRQLDVMLMVGALRCRATDAGLLDQYNQFVRQARGPLSDANAGVRGWFASQGSGMRGYDQHGTQLANRFGGADGISCADMPVAVHLAKRAALSRVTLARLADDLGLSGELPGNSCSYRIAGR